MSKIEDMQRQVDETAKLMAKNIEQVTERGVRLEALVDDTDRLERKSSMFKQSTTKLKCAIIRNNIKLTIIIIGLGFLLLLVLGCSIGFSVNKNNYSNRTFF